MSRRFVRIGYVLAALFAVYGLLAAAARPSPQPLLGCLGCAAGLVWAARWAR